MNEPIDALTFNALLSLMRGGMWLQNDIEKYLGNFGISHSRFSILLSLLEQTDSLSVSSGISEFLGISKPTVSKLMVKLQKEGLVICSRDSGDLRKKQLKLTDKGRALIEEIIPGYNRRIKEISRDLTVEDKRALIAITSRIRFMGGQSATENNQ